MTTPVKIDFVSDVACPWCAVGLASLERALEQLEGEIEPQLHFQPFELNPQMGPQGQDVSEHLTQKYGSTPEQQAQARENIRQRGEAVGFTFRKQGRDRVWNTFDAHRLLHWAGLESPASQRALKMAMLEAYHGEGRALADHAVLLDVVKQAGLDVDTARDILVSDRYVRDVREQERLWTQQGIHAVPSVVVNDKWLIQGGQPPEVFVEALRQAAAESR